MENNKRRRLNSGVAALSCGETSGGSSSSSSSTSSNSGAGEGCDTGFRSPHSPSPGPLERGSRTEKEREKKCSNLETLISHKLHSPRANYNNNILQRGEVKPRVCCTVTVDMPSEKYETRVLPQMVEASIPKHVIHKVPHRSPTVETIPGDKTRTSEAKLKIQQGRITEYFKSQMKPTNGLKRDIASWIERATNKAESGKTAADNLEMYITYLSQTLNAKMFNGVKADKKPDQNGKHVNKPNENGIVPNAVSSVSTPTEIEKKPLPGLHPIGMRNGLRAIAKKPDSVKTTPTIPDRKTAKRIASKVPNKRTRVTDSKRPKLSDNSKPNKVGYDKIEAGVNSKSTEKKSLTSTDNGLLNGSTNLASIHEQMRQVFMKVPIHEIKQASADSSKSTGSSDSNDLDKVPSPVHKVNTPTVSVPDQSATRVENTNISNQIMSSPTLMLAAIRIPQQNIQPSPLTHVDQTNNIPSNNISLSTSNKLNNQQFVVPMVQNINGALVSIPGIMTKVGQNTMLPIQTHHQSMMQPRTNALVNQQPPQMFINGALLKINSPVHSTLQGGLITHKQITTTNTANVSFTMAPKNITTGVPTVMPSKQNFAVNLGHPLFVSSSGFILNPVNNMITTQTNTCLSHVQQAFNGNVVITSPMTQNVHHLTNTINGSISNLQMPPSNVSMPPMKLEDMNPVFISSPPQQQLPNQMVNTTIVNINSTTDVSTTTFVQNNLTLGVKNSCTEDNISDTCVTSATCDTIKSTPLPIVDSSVLLTNDDQPTSTNNPQTPSPRSRENSSDCIDVDNELCKVNSESLDEVKSRSESVSLDSTRLIETPSVESPSADISKEVDEDSFLTCISTKEELNTPKKMPIPISGSNASKSPSKNGAMTSRNQKRNRMNASKISETEEKCCRWHDCSMTFDDVSDLLEHLQRSHVVSQAGKPRFVCLWETCKVYNRPSCSRHWLERHVLSHGGKKLFRCIVEGCIQRFNTQLAYERHVNNHFENTESTVSSAKKTVEASGPKVPRRNSKKLRFRKQPWSARTFDYFDPGIMEGLQYRLTKTTEWRNGGAAGLDSVSLYTKERTPHCITMSAKILASRICDENRQRELFVKWLPEDVLKDEWISEKEFTPLKDVRIATLDAKARRVLYSGFCSSYRSTSFSQSIDYSEVKCINENMDVVTTKVKPINGTHIIPNGKIPQAHNILNNIIKTDSIKHYTAQELFSLDKQQHLVCHTNANGNTKLTGAKKRKQGRS